MSSEVQATLGTTCKGGGSFYVCDKKPSKFIGCCSVDACKTDDGVCPDDKLLYTSYDKFSHNLILAQDCLSDKPEVQWYTCGDIETPFMGCCSTNACRKDGCPKDKIFAAALSDDKENAAAFLPSASASASATGTPDDDNDGSGDGGLSKGAVGGIAAGASIAALLIIGGLVLFFLRRRKRNQTPGSSYEPYAGQPQPFAGSAPQSPEMQNGRFSNYSPYTSTHASPGLPQPSPPYWQASHNSKYGNTPSPYVGSMGSPDPSQAQFGHSAQNSYGGSGNNFVQELPAGSPHPGQMPNVSDLSYQGTAGRESEVSGLSGWGQQQRVSEMEASEHAPGTRR